MPLKPSREAHCVLSAFCVLTSALYVDTLSLRFTSTGLLREIHHGAVNNVVHYFVIRVSVSKDRCYMDSLF